MRQIAATTLVVVLAMAAPARAATAWTTDPAHSRLTFVATQSGGEFEGRFARFHADIAFDPRDLAGSRFRVTIETASADTQDETRDAALVGDDFFAASRWPAATYEASRFVATADGRYEARGQAHHPRGQPRRKRGFRVQADVGRARCRPLGRHHDPPPRLRRRPGRVAGHEVGGQ